jgi:DNA-binding LytR/AlgR family response regulator
MIENYYYFSQISECNIFTRLNLKQANIRCVSNLSEIIIYDHKQRPTLIFVDIRNTDSTFDVLLKADYFAYYIIIDAHHENVQNCFRLAREIFIRDYITTPITADKIEDCINRYNDFVTSRKANDENNLLIKEKGIHLNIATNSIKLLEGYGSYTRIHTADKVYIVSKTIKKIFELLPNQFIRTHRSFAVHQKQVRSLIGNTLLLHNGEYVKVSKAGRQIILNHLRKAG